MNTLKNRLPTVTRVLLGLVFVVFGLNGFLQFLPMQPPGTEAAGAFLGGLAAAGYFFPVLKGTEILAGLALLGNRFVPLALVVLAPIVVQIALFHLLIAPGALPMVVFLLAAEIYLAYAYRDAFRGVLNANARPAALDHGAPTLAKAA